MVKLSESAKFNKLNDLKEIAEEVVETTNTVVPFQGDGWDDAVNAINSIQIGPIDTAIKGSLWLSGFTAKLLSSIADGELHLQGVDYYGYKACMESNIFYAPPRRVSGSSMKQCFQDCSTLLSAELVGREENTTGYGTSAVTTWENAFYNDRMLKMVDADKWDMSRVTNMKNMFNGCVLLEVCNVEDWDLSSATTMESMFSSCKNLKYLDTSRWEESGHSTMANVTNIYGLFSSCSSLVELNVSNWNTSSFNSLDAAFSSCSALTTLDVSKWNVGNVTSMSYAFYGCSALTSLDVSKWNVGNVTSMYSAFHGCLRLSELDLSNWNCSVSSIGFCFFGCSSLVEIDLSNIDMTGCTSVNGIISNCTSLESIKGLNLSGLVLELGNMSVSNYRYTADYSSTATTLKMLTDCVLEGTLYRGESLTKMPNLDAIVTKQADGTVTVTGTVAGCPSLVSWFKALYDWEGDGIDDGKTSYEVTYSGGSVAQGPSFTLTQAQINRMNSFIFYNEEDEPIIDEDELGNTYAWTLWDFWTLDAAGKGWVIPGEPTNQRPTLNN